MELLLGKPVADKILKHLKDTIFECVEKPGLAVILIGQDEASKIYVSLKEKKAKEIGIEFFKYLIPESSEQDEILELIKFLNNDNEVHGIIVQLPIAKKFDTEKIIASIDPKKDVDGFHPINSNLFLTADGSILPVFPNAIMNLILSCDEKITNKKGLVIANSDEFGKIMCAMFEKNGVNCQYILSDNIPLNLGKIKDSDILVSAVGSVGLLNGKMLKDGCIVIDGGIVKVQNKVFGDVDFGSAVALDGYITPVPGGVGPVTIACLLQNVYLAFKAQQKNS